MARQPSLLGEFQGSGRSCFRNRLGYAQGTIPEVYLWPTYINMNSFKHTLKQPPHTHTNINMQVCMHTAQLCAAHFRREKLIFSFCLSVAYLVAYESFHRLMWMEQPSTRPDHGLEGQLGKPPDAWKWLYSVPSTRYSPSLYFRSSGHLRIEKALWSLQGKSKIDLSCYFLLEDCRSPIFLFELARCT